MKNKSAVRLLLVANFISGIAQGMSMIAIPTYFAQQSESNWFNIAYAFITVISLFWSLYGGTLIDKYNRKSIFLALNLFNGLAIGAVAYLESTTVGYTSLLAVAVFALTFWNYNLHYPCFYAFMQEITEREHYNKIASYIEVQSQLASALAGAGAALLIGGGLHTSFITIDIEPWSLGQIFALDAATYLVALAIIAAMRYIPIAKRKTEEGSVVERLKVGYQHLQKNPYVFLFGVTTYAVFIVVLLHVFNLAPLYVAQHLKAPTETFAISEIFYAFGAIFAGLFIHRLFGHLGFVKAIIILTFVTVLEFCYMIGSYSVMGFFIATALLGVTNAGIRVLRMSYLFKVLPNQVMGRTNSIFFLTNALSRIVFLSLFSLAFFHQEGHVIYAFSVLSIFMLCSVIVLMLFYSKIVLKSERKAG